MKKTILALSLAALSVPALAQEKKPAPDWVFTGNFGVASDYRFRGISQSNKAPAVQGGFDLAHSSGFYVGNWNSSVSTWASPLGAGVEMDLYGGYKTELAGFALDLGLIQYFYPGAVSGLPGYETKNTLNTREAYFAIGFGPLNFKTSYTMSKNYFGLGKEAADNNGGDYDGLSDTKTVKGTLYYDLTFSKEIAPKLTLKAHAGMLDVKNATRWGIKDYSLGFSYALEDSLSVSVTGYSTSLERNAKDGRYFENIQLDDNDNILKSKKLYGTGFSIAITKTF
jgi:uncharacterized protein (TIGR02001 family)